MMQYIIILLRYFYTDDMYLVYLFLNISYLFTHGNAFADLVWRRKSESVASYRELKLLNILLRDDRLLYAYNNSTVTPR